MIKSDDKTVSSQVLEAEIKKKLDPKKAPMLDRIVLAGSKVMFGKETHNMMTEQLAEDRPLSENLAIGISALMVMLYKQGNKTMPQDLIIPAGGILMAKACEFLAKSGDEVTDDDLREGMGTMTKIILKEFGAPPDVIKKLGGLALKQLDAANATEDQAAPQGQQVQPAPQMQQTPQAGGMLGNKGI